MKRLDSLKKIMERFAKDKVLTKEDSKLIIQMQASLKEHVLQGKCTYCAKNVDKKLSNKLNPELFKNAPNVNMLIPKPKTGIPKE